MIAYKELLYNVINEVFHHGSTGVMDILHIFHILLIPSFLHKSFTIESLSLY